MEGGEPPAPRGSGKALAETITGILGALTATVAIVIVPGAYAMRELLKDQELPSDLSVVAALPREFLLAFGFSYVFLPLLIIVTLVVVIAVTPGMEGRPNPALLLDFADRRSAWGTGLLAATVVGLIVGLPLMVDSSPPIESFFLAALTVVVWLISAHFLLKRYRDRDIPLSGIALAILVAGVTFLAWPLQFASTRAELSAATVCLADGSRIDGYLVGQTSDRVYIADPPIRIAVAVDDGGLRGSIQGTLRIHVYDIRASKQFTQAMLSGLERLDLIIASLDTLDESRLDDLVQARIPIIGYYDDPPLATAPESIDVHLRSEIANRSALPALVDQAIRDNPVQQERETDLRISSIPSGQVKRLVIGGLGACPSDGSDKRGERLSPSSSDQQ